MIYHYKCPECRSEQVSEFRGDRLETACRCGFAGPLRRVFGFTAQPAMPEHFNHTVGRPISSMRQFREELSRASDEATAQTGIEHRFAPLEWGDHQAFGATGEGIYESNLVREKQGLPLLPEI